MQFNIVSEDCRWICKVKEKIGEYTVQVDFTDYSERNDRFEWFVSLCVYKKRKHRSRNFDEFRATTSNGIKNLLFAKKCIKEFQEYCKTELRQDCEHWLIVQWTDNRRRKVYERGLNNLGFETTSYDGAKSLVWKWRGLNESREN